MDMFNSIKSLRIDIKELIFLVRDHPTIWDIEHDTYKNRGFTAQAWNEIAKTLNPEYDSMNNTEKRTYVRIIVQKWTHIRDSYNRYLKKLKYVRKQDGWNVRPYVYSKYMTFIKKHINKRKINDNEETTDLDNIKQDPETESDCSIEEASCSDGFIESTVIDEPQSKNPLDDKLPMVGEPYYLRREPEVVNRHMAFFQGVIPSLELLTDDEVLDFQMGVLQVLKDIKNKRQNN